MLKFLVTIQEPSDIRYRTIIFADSTFAAVTEMMQVGLHPNTYISARPATEYDVAQYGQLGVHI